MEKKQEKEKKDFFDKLSSLSGVFIAVAGFMATYLYNANQLKLEELKTKNEINATEVELLEKCMKYVTSSNEKEREFGYTIFANMGYEKLAINLIDIKDDKAGINVAKNIAKSKDSNLNRYAESIFNRLSKDTTEKVKQVLNYLETGDINKIPVAKLRYMGNLRMDTLLFNQAEIRAKELDVRTPLGRLVIYETFYYSGGGDFNYIIDRNKELNKPMKDSIDEREWIQIYIIKRIAHINKRNYKNKQEEIEKLNFMLNQANLNNLEMK